MKEFNYNQYLTDEDRIHVSFTQNRGKILKFSINYSARISGRWREIFRVDNCHGVPHTHRYYMHRKQFRVELGENNEQVFTNAKKYVVLNFLKIRDNYLRVKSRKHI